MTTNEIEKSFEGQDFQEKIRNAIRIWHYDGGVNYVFLAADDDSIPTRTVLVRLGYGEDDYIPSDYYYMCLDGDWNADRDNTYGEREDNVDLYPDVSVTRGTFHSKDEFMDYVNRVKYYETSMGMYVNRALFHSSTVEYNEDGSDYVDQIADVFPDSMEKHFLYQDEQSISNSDINNYLSQGVGYFLTMAHGDINGFYADYADEYYGITSIPSDSTRSTLVDIFSCHAGAIDRNCILESFFSHDITIAARASSRNDFASTTDMHVSFYQAIFDGKTLGDATFLYRLPYISYAENTDNDKRYAIMSMITLGEPLIKFYTTTPKRFLVKYYEDSINFNIMVFSQDSVPLSGIKTVLSKENGYLIIDTTDLNGNVCIPLSMLTRGEHNLNITGNDYLRLDTLVYVHGYSRPEIQSIRVSSLYGDYPTSGSPVAMHIKGNNPYGLPSLLYISCSIGRDNFYNDSIHVKGEFDITDTFKIPWFSGNRFLSCKAQFDNTNFGKDTSLLVYGPLIGFGGMALKNDTLSLSIVNGGKGHSDTLSIKVSSYRKLHSFTTVIPPFSEKKIKIPTNLDNFPISIGVHSNVIDTEFIIKDTTSPSPPDGLYAQSISEGVYLVWQSKDGLYNIYRGTDSSNLKKLNILPLLYPYYVDLGLSFDTTYYYAVTFIDSMGFESTLSHIVEGIPNPKLAPGWPQVASGLGYSSPLVADITPLFPGKEIIIGSFEDSLVYAFSKDGIPLPGWPVNIGDIVYSAPAAYDLDGDGYDEVVVAGGGSFTHVWALKGDGTVLDGWPVYVRKGNFTGPAIGDLNGDSLPEIVFVSRSGGVYVYNVHGTMLDSIHLYAGGFSPASIGDINQDDTMDIVIGCKDSVAGLWVLHMRNDTELVVNDGFPKGPFSFNAPLVIGDVRPDVPGLEIFGCSETNRAVLFDSNGDTLWTRPVNNAPYWYNPSISDIDGDQNPELLVNQGTGVAVFKSDGSYFPGYPTTKASGGTCQCITTDLNGDGFMEIFKGGVDGKLYALTENANIFPGFPIDLKGYAYPTPTIDDIDNDGTLELIAASWSNMVFVYELGIPDSFIGDWPTYQHDIQRTGNYNWKPLSGVKEKRENTLAFLDRDLIVKGHIYFNKDWQKVMRIDIYDITGRKVVSIKKPYKRSLNLSSGVYFSILKTQKGKEVKKRIIVLP